MKNWRKLSKNYHQIPLLNKPLETVDRIRWSFSLITVIFAQKLSLWVASGKTMPTSTHKISFDAEIKKKYYKSSTQLSSYLDISILPKIFKKSPAAGSKGELYVSFFIFLLIWMLHALSAVLQAAGWSLRNSSLKVFLLWTFRNSF